MTLPTLTAGLSQIADRYDVRAVLCATDECRATFAAGDVVAQGPGWVLLTYEADPAGS